MEALYKISAAVGLACLFAIGAFVFLTVFCGACEFIDLVKKKIWKHETLKEREDEANGAMFGRISRAMENGIKVERLPYMMVPGWSFDGLAERFGKEGLLLRCDVDPRWPGHVLVTLTPKENDR